jgi:hypothetical protein
VAELSLRIESGQGWLVARVDGPYHFAQLMALIPSIGSAVRAARARALLLDMTGIAFARMGMSDRFEVAVSFTQQALLIPVAVVGTEAMVDPRRFGELVAQNRGLAVRVFTEIAAAEAWLRGLQG